jgi:type I restriction enzyme M protein
MTLEQAIISIIRNHPEPMKPADISQRINRFNLLNRKQGDQVTASQVLARVQKHNDKFYVTEEGTIAEYNERISAEQELLRVMRNIVVHGNNAYIETVIPFLLFYLRFKSRPNTFGISRIERDADDISGKQFQKSVIDLVDAMMLPGIDSKIIVAIRNTVAEYHPGDLLDYHNVLRPFESTLETMSRQQFVDFFQRVVRILSGGRSAREFMTPDDLCRFVARVVDVRFEDAAIADPFAGAATLLSTVLSNNDKNVSVFANEIAVTPAVIGALLLLSQVSGRLDFSVRDTFAEPPKASFDWVVTQPPLHIAFPRGKKSPQQRDDVFTIIVQMLKRKGKAAVIVPRSMLISSNASVIRSRRRLVEKRWVTAIVNLPKDLFRPFMALPVCLVVIDKGRINNDVYLGDLSSISVEQFGYKSDEYGDMIKGRKTGDNAVLVPAHVLEGNDLYLLEPSAFLHDESLDVEPSVEIERLGNLVEKRIRGVAIPTMNLNDKAEGVPYVRITDLSADEKWPYLIQAPGRHISDIEQLQNTQYVQTGAIMLAKTGNRPKPTIYMLPDPGVVSNNIFCFTVKEQVNADYLVSQLNSPFVAKQFKRMLTGSGPLHITDSDLMKIQVPLPPLEEQIRQVGVGPQKERDPREGKHDTKVREEEIISSIKHRIAQYISPLSSDLQNLEAYFKRKWDEGVLLKVEKISARQNAATVAEVFGRMKENMKGIGETFDLMKKILSITSTAANFEATDMRAFIGEAWDTVKDDMDNVSFVVQQDEMMAKRDLMVPVDKGQLLELLRNFFINSWRHGFNDAIPDKVIFIRLQKDPDGSSMQLNLINNGVPFPDGFTLQDFTTFGTKGTHSKGTGIGGYLMQKVVDNHGGQLLWLGDKDSRFQVTDDGGLEHSVFATIHFLISLPYIH